MTPIIRVKNLVKQYGLKAALRGVQFEAQPGEFVAILGPNGAGKTTFLRILATLTRQTLGEIEVAGYRLPKEAASIRQRLGVVSHQPLLYGDLTAEENLIFYARLYGLDQTRSRVSEILELVGLSARKADLVRTFSRGMQQRLSIGRAVIHEPDILLLDEPHTGLDQDACAMLDTLLQKVAANQRTVIMTTHDMARAASLASRFDILSRGRFLASAPKESIPGDGLLAFYRQVLEAPAILVGSSGS